MKYPVQLECGHMAISDGVPTEYLRCGTCEIETHIFAIETREWKVRCIYPRCRMARWCGASTQEAARVQRMHAERHPSHERFNLDFLQHPDRAAEVSKIYGKRFPRNVLAQRPLPNRPRRRTVASEDIPPF